MKILILGANGFIGNALVRELLKIDDIQVYGLDLDYEKLDHSLDHPKFHFVEGDININNEWIEYHIKKCDIVIPLVAIATPDIYVKDPLSVFQLDFEANLKIIKWVAKYHKRVIFPSTSEVYGMCNDEKFNEYSSNLVLGPVHKSRWIYSCSKQLLDRVIIAYGEKGELSYTIFRPFNWIGSRLDSLEKAQLGNGRVVAIFICNLINNKPLVLVGGGEQKRVFTYISDGIAGLVKIVTTDDHSLDGKIINLGSPNNDISVRQLAEIMIEEYNKIRPDRFSAGIINMSEQDFYGEGYEDIPYRVPDIEEARKLLKWYPKIGVTEAVKLTLDKFLGDVSPVCQ